MAVEVTCETCGKLFETDPYMIKRGAGRFCSYKCADISRRDRVLVECKLCGKTFETFPSRLKDGKGKYCSQKCYFEGRDTRKERTCIHCGSKFKATAKLIEKGFGKYCSRKCQSEDCREDKICLNCGKQFTTFKSETKAGKGKYCSKKCYNESLKGRYVGEKSPNWKGGLTFAPYCSKFNDEFKERVRDFWNRKCGMCHKPESENSSRLSVHHVNYEKMVCCDDIPPLFMPLCSVCHGKTNFNRDYWEHILTEFVMIWFDGESYLPK